MIWVMLMELCSGTSLSPFSSKPVISPLSTLSDCAPSPFVFQQQTGIINTRGDWHSSQIHHRPIPDNLFTFFPPFPPLYLLKYRAVNPSSFHTFLPKDQGHEFQLALLCPSSSCALLPGMVSRSSEGVVPIHSLEPPPPPDHAPCFKFAT